MKIDRIYSGPATLLLDGRVLISGGFVRATCTGCGGVNTGSSELYDPKTGKFSLTGSMAVARNGHSATRLSDGRVLVSGGAASYSSDADGASAELYDPATGRFSRTGSMAGPRSYGTATMLPNGDVLIAGGEDLHGQPLASAELYHPATGTFSATGSMADPREHATATLLASGRVLIVGGARGLIGGQWDQLASAEIYDPATGRFSPTGPLGTARVLQSATLLSDGRVLVAGGESVGGILSSAELFDPARGAFSPTGSMTANRSLQPVVLLGDGRVLLVDGTDNDSLSAEVYDPATGKFSAIAPPLDVYMETATLLQDGRVLLTAGGMAELYVS